jgi:hypothetical protein
MDKTTLDDEEIGTLVDQKVQEAIGWFNSKLSLERESVTRYFNGELPKRQSPGSSSFISNEVYDSVESMKAQLLETFAAGQRIVRFDPQTASDVIDAANATTYTDYVVYRQNDGFRMFNDVIHDGLTARVGIAKVYWDKCEEYEEHEFEGLDEETVHALADHPDVHALDAEEQGEPGSGNFKGKATKKIDKSQVRFEVINPEEFSVEPQAKALNDKYFCVQRSIKTVDELVRQGYSRKKLLEWNAEDDNTLNSNPEVLARFQAIDSGVAQRATDTQDDLRHVLVNESYIKVLRDGDEHAKLYKVVRVGSVTLEIEEVDDLPFVVFVPLPIPHSFYGNNFAQRVIPVQNIRTVLTRAIVDHASITSNPRLQVLKGGVTNPKELLDNRLGGVINVTRPDAIQPLQQANLNPFVFQTLELLKSQNEETTGISSLSQGLNKDAISKQNSGAMVESLVSLSQTRQKIIARNFAQGFLIPLYIKVYNLVLANEKREKIIEVAGQWQEVDVTRWTERRSASVSLHLGYGEFDREAEALAQLGTQIAQDPQLNSCFQLPGRFKLAKDVFELKGHLNFLDYMTPPDKIKPPQPDPMQMKKVELEERKVAALEMQAKAAQHKIDMHGTIESMREHMAQLQRDFDNQMRQREEDRKESETASKIDVAQREISLVEKTPIDKESAIVNPR